MTGENDGDLRERVANLKDGDSFTITGIHPGAKSGMIFAALAAQGLLEAKGIEDDEAAAPVVKETRQQRRARERAERKAANRRPGHGKAKATSKG